MLTMITPEDILKQRAMSRNTLSLAHSANSSGFIPRTGCPCYTCRDALDPTGEEDARIQNEANTLPPNPPRLERQSAICLDCEQSHLYDEVCRPRKISLPPPSIGLRRHPFTPSLSPLVGIVSPRSLSDSSTSGQDQLRICHELEQKVKLMLQKLKRNYKRLETSLAEEKDYQISDEMTKNEMISNKMDAIDNLLDEINKV